MKRALILDRVEQTTAVLTDKNAEVLRCDSSLLPTDCREGDALYGVLDADGELVSLERRELSDGEKNRRRLSSLFEKNLKNKGKLQ